MSEDRYVFLVQWFDNTASLVRQYNLTFFPKDNAIEMFDIKNRRIFLKRSDYPQITQKDLFIGGIVSVYSRQLKIVDYADQFTKKCFQKQKGKSFLLIKPDAYMSMGKIINILQQQGFSITNIKMTRMTQHQAEKFISQSKDKHNIKANIEHLSSDLIVGIQVMADDIVNQAQSLASSISKSYGKSSIQNAIYASDSPNRAIRDRQFFFSDKSTLKCPALFTSCSCLVIKPHIIKQGYIGQIIDQIMTGRFQISAMQMFWLDKASAQVYKNLIPEYNSIIQQISSGPCIAIQARQNNAVPALREICGPHDPQVAKTTRPKSIRSIFGKDKVNNAVHCTDLMEDGLLEVQYFFNILQK